MTQKSSSHNKKQRVPHAMIFAALVGVVLFIAGLHYAGFQLLAGIALSFIVFGGFAALIITRSDEDSLKQSLKLLKNNKLLFLKAAANHLNPKRSRDMFIVCSSLLLLLGILAQFPIRWLAHTVAGILIIVLLSLIIFHNSNTEEWERSKNVLLTGDWKQLRQFFKDNTTTCGTEFRVILLLGSALTLCGIYSLF